MNLRQEEFRSLVDIFLEEELCEGVKKEGKKYESGGIPVFSHPLAHQVFYSPMLNRSINGLYNAAINAIERRVKESRRSYISLFDSMLPALIARPYHVQYLHWLWSLTYYRYTPNFPGLAARPDLETELRRLWLKTISKSNNKKILHVIARDLWIECENISQYLEYWMEYFDQSTDGFLWMNRKDKEGYRRLPDTVTIYRGNCDDGGISWSTKKDVAEFFANRGMNGSTGVVLSATVKKRDIYAYFHTPEREVVVLDVGLLTDCRELSN